MSHAAGLQRFEGGEAVARGAGAAKRVGCEGAPHLRRRQAAAREDGALSVCHRTGHDRDLRAVAEGLGGEH